MAWGRLKLDGCDEGLSTNCGDSCGCMGVAGFLEDFFDAVCERFVSAGSSDGVDSDKKQEGVDKFGFHGMRMLFVFC